MRIFILAVGDRRRASSRLRVWDHEPWFRASFSHASLDYLLDSTSSRLTFGMLWRMLWKTPGWVWSFLRADIVLIQETLWLTPLLRLRNLGKSRRIVFDFSDPVDFIGRGLSNRIRRASFTRMTAVADRVICENPLYFDELHTRRAGVLRQVGPVDARRYQAQREPGARERINIGWTGSGATFDFIRPLLPVLDEIAVRRPIDLTLIGAPESPFAPRALRIRSLQWSEELEFREVPKFDLGLFALDRTPKSERRGAGKLFIYMAAGVPFIATEIGIGADTMRRYGVGFEVRDDADWRRRLEEAIDDADRRTKFAIAGMAIANRDFSYESYRGLLVQVLLEPA